ncbi:hypothetical protein [Sphingobium yanoikuyae]
MISRAQHQRYSEPKLPARGEVLLGGDASQSRGYRRRAERPNQQTFLRLRRVETDEHTLFCECSGASYGAGNKLAAIAQQLRLAAAFATSLRMFMRFFD